MVSANGIAMTVFCWHMTALVGAIGLWQLAGLHLLGEPTAAWWMTRPLWLLLPGALLAALVSLFRGVEFTGR